MGAKQKKAPLKSSDDKCSNPTRNKRVRNASDTFAPNKKNRPVVAKSNTKENKNEMERKNATSISTISSWKNSVVHFGTSATIGSNDYLRNLEPVKNALVNHFEGLKVFKVLNLFERRVTSIECHPKYTNYVAAGSKGGELILFDLNSPRTVSCPGVGPGGSIVGLKFCRDVPSTVYTASVPSIVYTGNVKEENMTDQSKSKTFLTSATFENWFASLDVCYSRKLIFTGDCRGNAYLITTAGQWVWPKSKKLHSDKISHVEFHPRDPNVFVTASIDHSVKLWDLRMIGDPDSKGRYQPTEIFPHLKGVNSAYFSPSNGCSLLTTDQHSELRVYSCENWKKFMVIPHPHRQFRHLTHIKLNVFNSSGDAMISATGTALLVWKKECCTSSDRCLPCPVSGTKGAERGRRPALNKKVKNVTKFSKC
ncbi:DNA damage-binding protein 2-like isoform X2 [Uloborus diversus]|uniref:DNA damage-binding protein 2-like isoform X2 n=1 Tax=Uloborus diversus TaxID=327109 RepID=UPI00240921A5|nr:DNA damage-binding protein 2-like isoform X2 [Uloborus diversus]